MEEISRWATTQCVRETQCPRCGAVPGAPCRQPSGRKTYSPHVERTTAYFYAIGSREFDRRHTGRGRVRAEEEK